MTRHLVRAAVFLLLFVDYSVVSATWWGGSESNRSACVSGKHATITTASPTSISSERLPGFEPGLPAWQASLLPLQHRRILLRGRPGGIRTHVPRFGDESPEPLNDRPMLDFLAPVTGFEPARLLRGPTLTVWWDSPTSPHRHVLVHAGGVEPPKPRGAAGLRPAGPANAQYVHELLRCPRSDSNRRLRLFRPALMPTQLQGHALSFSPRQPFLPHIRYSIPFPPFVHFFLSAKTTRGSSPLPALPL